MKGTAGRRGDLKGKLPAHADENTAIDDAVASGVLSRSRGKALGPEGGASTSAVALEGVSTVRELDARYVEQLRKLDGCDVTKRGTIRKGRSCVILPGQINLAAAGGVIGSLEKLDTKKPLLYVDTPKGRIRMSGSIVYPKTKYMTFALMKDHILCEDIFDSLLVFSSWAWIGTKEENPEEKELPLPCDLAESLPAGADVEFGGGIVRHRTDAAEMVPKASIDPVKRDTHEKQPEKRKSGRPMRQSAAKRKSYSEADSDGDGDGDSDGSDEDDVEGGSPARPSPARGCESDVIVIENTPPSTSKRKRQKKGDN